jgi:hypothetical protein
MHPVLRFAALLALAASSACTARDESGVDLRRSVALNRLAYIPPQCFTKTRNSEHGPTQNPCYVCHAQAREPNYADQPELQLAYAFPQRASERTVINRWSNLFVDRSTALARISDQEVQRYISADNYHDAHGRPALAGSLARLPAAWDTNGDGRWNGYVPDAAFRFDAGGFDRETDGRATGWRSFSYYPFPGAFMPTNGSFDDVLIRLPRAFRQRDDGSDDETVYAINLAVVEALIKRSDVVIDPADENVLGVDLDADGRLGLAQRVAFNWAPLQGRGMSYVGPARREQAAGRVHLAAGLYPEGTEFLHSVRYLATDADGRVHAAPRMKELRYARKRVWSSYSNLQQAALREIKEGELNPGRAEQFSGNAETGLDSRIGWTYQGFIEDARGRLRPQSFEETAFCLGCHGGLSATEDGSFAFPRKLDGSATQGWAHWSNSAAQALPDPLRDDGRPEYATYLLNNQAGDEYRANDEVRERFFQTDGSPRPEAFAALAQDVAGLMLPSARRALALDKAYWLVVREQSFSAGRDALLAPAMNVHREVARDTATGIAQPEPAPRLRSRAAPAASEQGITWRSPKSASR